MGFRPRPERTYMVPHQGFSDLVCVRVCVLLRVRMGEQLFFLLGSAERLRAVL